MALLLIHQQSESCETVTRSKGGAGSSYPEFGENVHVGGGGSGTGRDYQMGGSSHGGGGAGSPDGQPHTGGGGVGGGGAGSTNVVTGPAGNGASGTVLLRYPLSSCVPCPVGHYAASVSSNFECTPCPVNPFASQKGSVSCSACPPGKRTLADGSTSPSDCVCNTGTYGFGDSECINCERGSFWSEPTVPNTALFILDRTRTGDKWRGPSQCAPYIEYEGCYDRAVCKEAALHSEIAMSSTCWLLALEAGEASENFVRLDFSCVVATAVSFSMYVDSQVPGSQSFSMNVDDINWRPWSYDFNAARWETDNVDSTWQVNAGVHTLQLGLSSKDALVSHIRFAEGSGACYFYTDGDPSTSVCTQCGSWNESVPGSATDSSCQTCEGGGVFREATKACEAGTHKVVTEAGWPSCEACPDGTFSGAASTTCTPCAIGRGTPYGNMTTSPQQDTCTCLLGYSYTEGVQWIFSLQPDARP